LKEFFSSSYFFYERFCFSNSKIEPNLNELFNIRICPTHLMAGGKFWMSRGIFYAVRKLVLYQIANQILFILHDQNL